MMRRTNYQVFSHTDNLGLRDGRENYSRFDLKHQSTSLGRPVKATQYTEKTTSRHIIIQLLKTSDNEKNFKNSQRNQE